MKWLALAMLLVACAPVAPRVQPQTLYLPLVVRPALLHGVSVPRQYWNCNDLTQMRAEWAYDWSASPGLCPGVESIPMIWGRDIPSVLGGNSKRLLVLNEPDNCSPGAACIPPNEAAAIYRQVESRWPDRLLTSPAVFNNLDWLKSWYAGYLDKYGIAPRMAEVGAHCYWPTLAECIDWIGQHLALAAAWGVGQVRVTEFSFASTDDLSAFVDYLRDRQIPYAYYASRVQAGDGGTPADWVRPLLDMQGHETEYGTAYRARVRVEE